MEENPVISCGGFKIDNSSLIEENGILKALPGEPKLPHATVENNGKIFEKLLINFNKIILVNYE